MTKRDALAEARRRWGFLGSVWYYPKCSHSFHFRVGTTRRAGPDRLLVDCKVKGIGGTWEAAFADADRREKEAG